jgi:uncharacterized membrane protein
MPAATPITELAQEIQLAVAPVFLLSGIAGLLSVFTLRLGRITDRMRVLEEMLRDATEPQTKASVAEELARLRARARLANRAIRLCTLSALLIAAVIAALFLGTFAPDALRVVVVVSFVAAMALLIGGLFSFLVEVNAAVRPLRHPRPEPPEPALPG